MKREAVSKRLSGWFVFVLGGIPSVGAVLAIAVNWPLSLFNTLAIIGFSAELWAFLYLVVLTKRVLVTTTHVRVDYVFSRLDVPRGLVAGVEVDPEMLSGHLIAEDADGKRRIAVPVIFRRYDGDPTSAVRRLRRDGSELSEMLEAVPAVPVRGGLRKRLRIVNVLVAAGAILGFGLLGIYAAHHPRIGP